MTPVLSLRRFAVQATAFAVGAVIVGGVLAPSSTAFATDPACGPTDADGVHQVSTAEHLKAVGSGGANAECGLGATYFQVGDIDVSSETSWTGIGTSTNPFTGEYRGNFKTISGGQRWGDAFKGIFAHVGAGGIVRDLGVTNIVANATAFAGLLVGENKGTVSNSFATGSITTSGSYIGGLVGHHSETGTIERSFASVTIRGLDGAAYIGGLAGLVGDDATIEDSYATGFVSGYSFIGGLVGSSTGSISRTYAATEVERTFEFGFVGGLVGSTPVGVQASYYDQDVSGQTGGPGEAKPSFAMRTHSTFSATWAIVDGDSPDGSTGQVWGIHPSKNSGYPFLWWQEENAFCPAIEEGVRPIRTPQQLAAVGSGGNDGNCSLRENYEVKNDIDLLNFGDWHPIGGNTNTTGFGNGARNTFDGGSHTIAWLKISSSDTHQGLFAYISGGVTNTGSSALTTVTDFRLIQVEVAGGDYVGALAGENRGLIDQVSVEGTVRGNNYVGGVVGLNGNLLRYSFSGAHLSGLATDSSHFGGIAGQNPGFVIASYAAGDVEADSFVGGLVGQNALDSTAGTILNSMAISTVRGRDNAGAVTPSGYGEVSGSFYDSFFAGPVSGAGTPKTSAEMRDIATFPTPQWPIVVGTSPVRSAGEIWGIDPSKNSGYPFLWWQTQGVFCEPSEPPLLTPGQPNSLTNPYRVLTPGHLRWIAGEDLSLVEDNGALRTSSSDQNTVLNSRVSGVYRQDVDINLSECGHLPIGIVQGDTAGLFYPFTGTYDGNDHAVSAMGIVGGSTGYLANVFSQLGFFGLLDGKVSNLTLNDVVIDATAGNSLTHAGMLAGKAWTGTEVRNVSASGTILRAEDYVGGLIGEVDQVGSGTDATILDSCAADITISPATSADGFHFGGLVGSMDQVPNDPDTGESFTEIDSCSVKASITTVDHVGFVGGLVGRILEGTNTGRVMITDSFNTEPINLTVKGGTGSYVAGVVGLGSPVLLDVEVRDLSVTTIGTPEYVGGLVGQLESRGLVDDALVKGTINVAGAGGGNIGGLVGMMAQDSDLEDSEADITLNVSNSTEALNVGGLVGFQDDDANVRSSFATGDLGVSNPTGPTASIGGITGRFGNGALLWNSWSNVLVEIDSFDGTNRVAYVGGVVGDMDAPDAEIVNSYTSGTVSADGSPTNAYVGEFLGRRVVNNGVVGDITGGTYRDAQEIFDSVGTGPATGITGASSSEMETLDTFTSTGWAAVAASANDLPTGPQTEIWGLVPGSECTPFLWWQAEQFVQHCVVPATATSPTGSRQKDDPVVAPLAASAPPSRAVPSDARSDEPVASDVTAENAEKQEAQPESAEVLSDAGENELPAPQENPGFPMLWTLALAGLGVLALLGGGLAWWRMRL